MSPLLETIKLKDGRLFNLEYHNRRYNKALKEYFGISSEKDLSKEIIIPNDKKQGLFRCRIIYNPHIESIEFIPQVPRAVKSLKLVYDNRVDYSYKYSDRSYLDLLFTQRGSCDDILIVKNGCITDSYTATPIFFDGEKWWCPDTPLLPGTKRARYLAEGRIGECRITPRDISRFEKSGLINASWDMEDMPVIAIDKIR